jgi:intergrase/recombinase
MMHGPQDAKIDERILKFSKQQTRWKMNRILMWQYNKLSDFNMQLTVSKYLILHFNNKVQGKIVSVHIMKAYMWHSTICGIELYVA